MSSVKIWARKIAPETQQQLGAIAREPFIHGHVAAMPDAHVAQGVAVGTVFATKGFVVPAALGGDLGCGVSGLCFPRAANAGPKVLERTVAALHAVIPVGDGVQRGGGVVVPETLMAQRLATHALGHTRDRLAPRQLGTLGGGNHFIELDRDVSGNVWLLIHSGSRGLGQAIAAHHLRATRDEGVGKLRAVSVHTSEAARACLADMTWACDFARANRDHMLRAATQVVSELLRCEPDPSSHVDTHHNFVAEEIHAGETLLVHRKGAIAAPAGRLAIIPGSMGTATYVVRGLGEPTSWCSASHGAGRVMNRNKARARIRPEQLLHAMKHVVFDTSRLRALVEEAPAAYRHIEEVLEDERDLVEPLLRLTPMAVIKGT